MTRKPVLLQFTEELLDELDRLSEAQGRSRSAVVREAVRRYVTDQSTALKDEQMREAYRRIPDNDEFADWAEASLRQMIEEEPW